MSGTEYAIGRHCGVTFAGLKIASLVSLPKQEEGVIAMLSRKFSRRGFAFRLLREDAERLLVYVCHRERLEKHLALPETRAFLARFGYEYAAAEEALEQLQARMGGEFPHEIGVFLGYPLCDVCGFLRDPDGCVFMRRLEGVRKRGGGAAHVRAAAQVFRLHLPPYEKREVAHTNF